MEIVWFRQDLRVLDNPALSAAANNGAVLPIYILDDINAESHKMGSASRVWLYHALQSLNSILKGNLKVFSGDAKKIILSLCEKYDIEVVRWNRCYEPWRIARDQKIKKNLNQINIEAKSYNGSLLWEPWDVLKSDGTPYKVFTPYFRKGCLKADSPRALITKPKRINFYEKNIATAITIEDLNLLPKIRWNQSIEINWSISEADAREKLTKFLKEGILDYKEGRNFPSKQCVSRLSPYLHFGQISPHQIWFALINEKQNLNTDHFKSELGWREFSHSLLYHFPTLPSANLQQKFNRFPWHKDEGLLKAWQYGQTGYPIIDAGMRELWQTGYMHNRIRMIVGSFLVKNLLLHWHHGEAWFWDCLVDADLANNSASWQWIAGCGADAAPYFRVFNPVTQGEKFDENGEYTRHYVPELKNMPNKYLFRPWEAPNAILDVAGIRLGENYPMPIVDLKASRLRALEAYASLKNLD